MIIWAISSMSGYGSTTALTVINSDGYGHLGGFLTGILIGLCIPEPIETTNYTKGARIVGLVLSGVFFLLCWVLFYTTKGP